MNKTKLLILFSFLLCTTYELTAQSFCSTPATTSNENMNSSFQMRSVNNNSYCLNVYFHVIRRSNGTGGQTIASVNEAFNILNQDFNPHNISFSWDNQIDYIDNDSYYGGPTNAIFNVNNHQDGIDIYLYDDASSAGGRANGVGESSEFWVSGSFWNPPFNSLTTSHVISHEMGHVLFLWHTHHGTFYEGGTDINQCAELVNGDNSQTCGDYVEDTPADPHLQFNVNPTNCEWQGIGTDANGDIYNPDENNVMAYTDINCMEYFTVGQGERMRNAISSLSYLQQTISNNCIVYELSTLDFLCNQNDETITIINHNEEITTSWETSSNVNIVSNTNESITVSPVFNYLNGLGWVKATLSNGIILEESFWVGNPSSNGLYFYSSGNFEISTHRWYQFTAHHQNFSYLEHGHLNYEWQIPYAQLRMNPPKNKAISVYPTHTGVYPYRVRSKNPCGCSNWVTQHYIVEQEPGDDDLYIGPAQN